MATEAVFKYLKNQNRPYSTNDIVQNLHKEFGKTAVQKSLDQLVQEEKIKEKTYGKQKVYCIIQESSVDPSIMQTELNEMEEKINSLQETLTQTEEKVKSSEQEMKSLQSSLTTEQAKEEKDRLVGETEKLKTRLKDLTENSVQISAETKKKIEEEYSKNMKEYRKRKRLSMDVVNSILEGYPKKKKDLLEEIGVETDEDVGCDLSNIK